MRHEYGRSVQQIGGREDKHVRRFRRERFGVRRECRHEKRANDVIRRQCRWHWLRVELGDGGLGLRDVKVRSELHQAEPAG